MTRKMDRFEKAVLKLPGEDIGRMSGHCWRADVLKLLINEHAWIRRDVQKVRDLITKQDMERDKVYEGMAIAFDHVLTRLTQRRG